MAWKVKRAQCRCVDKLTYDRVDADVIKNLDNYLDKLKRHYRRVFNAANKAYEHEILAMQEEYGKDGLIELMDSETNESLNNFVTNRNSLEKTIEHDGELIQKSTPIYTLPYNKGFFNSHFYSPRKFFFGGEYDTFWANTVVIWVMTLFLIITLYLNALKFFIDLMGKAGSVFSKNKR